jgi:hypothetical protein
VSVVPGLQTQIFITDQRPALGSPTWAAAKLSMRLVDADVGFDPAAPDIRTTEELLNLLAADAQPRFSDDLRALVSASSYPLASLAFWVSQCSGDGTRPCEPGTAIEELSRRLPGLLDAELLRLITTGPGAGRGEAIRLRYPPMLTRVWNLLLKGENQGLTRVEPCSPAARLGPGVLGGGPWLRFREPRGTDQPQTRHALVAASANLRFSGEGFEEFVRSLRTLVRDEVSSRVQFNSPYLTLLERRLIALLCPAVDTIRQRIKEASREGSRGEETGGDQSGGKGASEKLPTENDLVLGLNLPRASISLLASTAIDKLTRWTILPTSQQLDEFIDGEIATDSVVSEPLRALKVESSAIRHVVEQKPMPLLDIVYLFYHRCQLASDDATMHGQIATMFNRLGYAATTSPDVLTAGHIAAELTRADEFLQSFYDHSRPPRARTIWEEVIIRLVPRRQYTPGHLCVVERRSVAAGATPKCELAWQANALAYSASLCAAAPAMRGTDSAEWPRTSGFATAQLSRTDYLQNLKASAFSERWDAGDAS